jgi:hypothetical protein
MQKYTTQLAAISTAGTVATSVFALLPLQFSAPLPNTITHHALVPDNFLCSERSAVYLTPYVRP